MAKADFKGERQNQRRDRPGHHITRVCKGDPRVEARRERAAERLAAHVCGPTCKAQRKAAA